MKKVYGVNLATINEYIKNIYTDNEFDEDRTIRKFRIVQKEGINEKFYIDSAATSSEEIGNQVHYGTRNKIKQMNIECGNHLA